MIVLGRVNLTRSDTGSTVRSNDSWETMMNNVPSHRPRVAYLTMGFPIRSETAVVREMYVLNQESFDVHVFSTRPVKFEGIYEPKADVFKKKSVGFSAEVALQGIASTVKRVLWGDRRFFKTLATTIRRSGLMLPKTLPVLVLAAGYADRAEQMGIAYIHANFAALQGYAVWAIHQMTGIPYGFTMHAYDLFEQGFMMPEKVGSAVAVVSISHFNVRYIQELWGIPPEGIHIIRCGVDVGEFTFVERERGSELRLLSVGAAAPHEGLHPPAGCDGPAGEGLPGPTGHRWRWEGGRAAHGEGPPPRPGRPRRPALAGAPGRTEGALPPCGRLRPAQRPRRQRHHGRRPLDADGGHGGWPAVHLDAPLGHPRAGDGQGDRPPCGAWQRRAAGRRHPLDGRPRRPRRDLGRKGREKVEAEYDATRNARKLAEVVAAAIGRHSQALSA